METETKPSKLYYYLWTWWSWITHYASSSWLLSSYIISLLVSIAKMSITFYVTVKVCWNRSGTWQETRRFQKTDTIGLGILHPIMNLTGSLLSCMIYCHKTPDCLLFLFNGDEVGMCQLSSSALLSNISTSAGVKIYKNLCNKRLSPSTLSSLLAQGQWGIIHLEYLCTSNSFWMLEMLALSFSRRYSCISVRKCAGVCGSVRECAGVCGNVRECVGVQKLTEEWQKPKCCVKEPLVMGCSAIISVVSSEYWPVVGNDAQ